MLVHRRHEKQMPSHPPLLVPCCDKFQQKNRTFKTKPTNHPTSVPRWPNWFFNIWPFTTMKICPKAYKLSQSGLTTLPNTFQKPLNIWPKISQFVTKSGHTASIQLTDWTNDWENVFENTRKGRTWNWKIIFCNQQSRKLQIFCLI